MSTIPQSLPSTTLSQEAAGEDQARCALVRPLYNYHGLLVSSFDALPQEGVFCELLKRICIIAVAPLAYLVLGLLALPRMTYDLLKSKCCPDVIANEEAPPVENINRPQFEAPALSQIQDKILQGMEQAINYQEIRWVKLFLQVKINDTYPVSHQFTIKLGPDPVLDRSAFEHCVQEILDGAQALIPAGSYNTSIVKWHILMKDVNDNMIGVSGQSTKSSSHIGERGPTIERVLEEHARDYHANLLVAFDDPTAPPPLGDSFLLGLREVLRSHG